MTFLVIVLVLKGVAGDKNVSELNCKVFSYVSGLNDAVECGCYLFVLLLSSFLCAFGSIFSVVILIIILLLIAVYNEGIAFFSILET